MQRNPSRSRHASPTSSPAGLSRGEWMRLWIVFLLAASFTTAFLSGVGGGKSEEVKPPIWEPDVYDGPTPDVEVEVSPWRPRTEELNRIIKETTAEDRVRTYPRALELLARDLITRPHVSFKLDPEWKEQGGYEVKTAAELLDINRSDELRARPVEVVGVLESSGILDTDADLGLSKEKFPFAAATGILKSGESSVRFIWLEKPALPVFPGQKVRLQGVFYRVADIARPVARENGESERVFETMPVVLAKNVCSVIPLELRDEPPLAEDIRDILSPKDVKDGLLRDEVFYSFLGWVMKKGDEVVASETPMGLEGKDPKNFPERYRLKPVVVKGMVVYARTHLFEYEEIRASDTPGGLLGCCHLVVAQREPENNVPINVIIPKQELPEGCEVGELVELSGIYYGVYAYKNRKQEHVQLPLIVAAGTPRTLPPPPAPRTDLYIWVFVAIGASLVLGLLGLMVRDRRRGRVLEEKIRSQRSERRQSMNLDQEARSFFNGPEDEDSRAGS